MSMLHMHVSVSGERSPVSLLLDKEQQYKIMASVAMLDMMALISKPYGNDPEKLTLYGDPKLIVSIGMLATRNPSDIGPYLKLENECARKDALGMNHKEPVAPRNTSAVRAITEDLDIMDESLRFTPRFAAAVGIRTRETGNYWDNLYSDNDLGRFGSVTSETVKHYAKQITPLSNSGPTLLSGLKHFLHEAEFWIGHYDPRTRSSK